MATAKYWVGYEQILSRNHESVSFTCGHTVLTSVIDLIRKSHNQMDQLAS